MSVGDFIVARNPDEQSRLPFLLCLPLHEGPFWLKSQESWPRARRVYCHPADAPPPQRLEVLERVLAVKCERRGSAIDLVLARAQLRRSQFVFTTARGRPAIFWQTPSSARAAKPGLRIPTGHASTCDILYVDTRERYGYTFSSHGATIERRRLSVGDYAAADGEGIIGVVERKSLSDFATSIVGPSLGFEMAELTALPLAAVVVEASYSSLLRAPHVRAGLIPELIARLQVRYPHVSINFLESRKVAEEWTFRFLRAAYANAEMLRL